MSAGEDAREDVLFVNQSGDRAAVNHGQLRNLRHPHPAIRRQQCVVGRHHHDLASVGAAIQQTRQSALVGAVRDKSLVAAPRVVKRARKILVARVADQRHDALRLFLFAAPAQRRRQQRAA